MGEEASQFLQDVGETAGLVWRNLDRHGPMSLTRLAKEVGRPRDQVMQALGWLAREGKVDLVEQGRSRVVALR